MKQLAYGLMLVLICACASSGKQPEWVMQPKTLYDEQQYLSAVGQGDNIDQANTRAQANLAKMFSVSIYEKQIDASSFNSDSGQTSTDVSRHINSEARMQLEGAKIVEHYQSEAGQVYALVVLDKSIAARNFREDIRQADTQIDERLKYASGDAPNVFSALSALKEAHGLALKRENLNRNLIVVADRGIATSTSSADIETLFRNAMSSLKFSLSANSDELKSQLSASASDLGLAIVSESPLQISASLNRDEVFEQQGWYWLRASLNLALSEQGKVTRKLSQNFKVSARQQGALQSRLNTELENQFDEALFQLLLTDAQP
ncbi:LPP20 family lipoprotein [Agaribacterium haliotis]|uniref:LPP20 family lipoprotein n=1 Tax=Agaribacterium haliotis TaxID=2013869 RepID=UPI0011777247|nr:LPP20 family lipoprotein [Agaribacterium haliotis]